MSDTIEFAILFDNDAAFAEIRNAMAEAFNAGADFLVQHFKTLIVDPLILGGKGWKALIDTPSWRWINSPKGYGQLGFTSSLEPLKLLTVLRNSFSVKKVFNFNKRSDSIRVGFEFNMANLSDIRKATIHPAAGQLNLPADRSWFDWVFAGQPLKEFNYHFKKTGPRRGSRSSGIAGVEAGLMAPGGFWEVAPRFRIDIEKLFERNENKITRTIEDFMQDVIAEKLK